MQNATHKNRLSEVFPGSLSEVDTLFNQFFGQGPVNRGLAAWRAPASLWEENERYYIEVDAPGVSRESADVTFDKGVLSITLERATGEQKYHHNERGFGKVTRTITLPDTVDPESIEAELVDGVLKVSIAKTPESQPRKIELK